MSILEMEGNYSVFTDPPNVTFGQNPLDFVMDLSSEKRGAYAVPINGYFSPFLICFTVITNILVVMVLLKKHMRTPTNAILAGMAVSDMFTGLFPLPVFIYFYSIGNYKERVPIDWCFIFDFFGEHIPTIFHTASIWLTMALAIQRYIYICHSFQARKWCTMQNVLIGTAIIYAIATLAQVCRFVEQDYIEQPIPSRLHPNKTIISCVRFLKPWVFEIGVDVYYNMYFWFRVICIHFIPCTFLVVLNLLLILTMRTAQIRRMQLLKQNKKSESRKLKDSNCTTLMLVAVVGLFLLVEFPMGIIMILNIVRNTFTINIFDDYTFYLLSLISNFFILLSYPLNFFIYCGMSRQFRETFKRLFIGGSMPIDRDCSQYMTLPVENGHRTQMTGGETVL